MREGNACLAAAGGGATMKLSDLDRENIEALESLDIDENDLFLLLCRYFAYRRGRQFSNRLGYSPDNALVETIRWRMDSASRRSQGAKDGWEIRRAKQQARKEEVR